MFRYLYLEIELSISISDLAYGFLFVWYCFLQNFPILFHHVLGKDEREANSPSFFNVAEIEVLVSYLQDLLQTQGKKGIAKISPKEIGIIAPYRKQVQFTQILNYKCIYIIPLLLCDPWIFNWIFEPVQARQ